MRARSATQICPMRLIDEIAGAATLGPVPAPRGRVTIVSAGTSDAPVAARGRGHRPRSSAPASELINDVGVAGLHRVLGVRDRAGRLPTA